MLKSIYRRLHNWLNQFFENALFRRIVKNSGYLLSGTGISAAISMLQGILVVRLVGIADYGILGTIIAFTSVINNLVSFRMGELVVKYISHYSETGEPRRAIALFKLAALAEMTASILAFLLVVALSFFGAKYLTKDPTTQSWFILYGLVILFNLISESSTGLLQYFNRFREIAAYNLAQSVVTLLLIGIAFLAGGGVVAVLLAYLAGKAVSSLSITVSALREATRQWGKGWQRASLSLLSDDLRELVHFGLNTNLSGSISLITKDSEILWVSLFRSPLEAGYYRLALSFANLVQLPVNPLPQATYPELAREATRQSWDNFRQILRQGSTLAGIYTLLASAFLVLFGKPLLSWLYTPESLPAYPALMILVVGILFANTFFWRRVALLALGVPGFSTKLNLILALIKVGLILLLVPSYGYLASAALLSAFYVAVSLISLSKVRSLVRERELALQTAPII